jgi:hypothetical protein
MSFQIEDGKGSGKRAEVSPEYRLRTQSVVYTPQLHASLVYQKAFQAVSGVRNITSAGAYGILAVKNEGSDDLAVTYIRIGVDKTEVLQAKAEILIGGTWVAGTAAEIHNMNAKSAISPEAIVHYNSIPTSSNVIDTRWAKGPSEMTWSKEGSIIVPTGGIVALRITTETDAVNIHGRISFIVIPAAVKQSANGFGG